MADVKSDIQKSLFNLDEIAKVKQEIRRSLGKPDLGTSEGLLDVANRAGGPVASAANRIVDPNPGFFGKVGNALKSGVKKTLDVLQRPNYAVASAVKNVIDEDESTGFLGGLKTGITGQTKNTFHDVFSEANWNPESRAGRIAKGVSGFALDVLLDPTTYLTFGAGAGIKIGGQTVSKTGINFAADVIKQSGKIGEVTVREALEKLSKTSPELYQTFLDKGGVKFFGKTLVSSGRIAGVLNAIPGVSKLDTATQPMRNTLYGLFNRDAAKSGGKLPDEWINLEQKLRDLSYAGDTQAIKRAEDLIRANGLNINEAKIINNAIEAKLPLADARLENVRKQIQASLARNLKNEQAAGIATKELPNYVPHMLVKEEGKLTNFKPPKATVKTPFTKERKILGTVESIKAELGVEFDDNIIRTMAIRDVVSNRAVKTKEFLQSALEDFGKIADEAPSNYIETGIKELDGYKFHPDIAARITEVNKAFIGDEATNVLLKQFDQIQNFWKASVTQIFPAFHGRNAISNVFLNFLDIGADSLNPIKHATAVDLLNKNRIANKLELLSVGGQANIARSSLDNLLAQPILKDISGKTWTFGELREVITNNRVAFGNEFSGAADVTESVSQALKKVSTLDKGKKVLQNVNPLSSENILFKAGRTVGNTVEEQARLVNFITNLQRTGDVETAAGRVKQFLFDYQNLSPFEKNVMRRLIPFYTFTRKNLELQVKQFLKQPGKITGQAKLFSSISSLASGAGLTDEEQDKLPGFLKQGLGIVIGRDGANVEILNSLGTPLEAVFGALQKNNILGSISPTISIPLQLATQRSFFYDRPLDEVNDATAFKDAPDFIKEYIGFTVRKNKDGSERYVALNPTRLFIVSNLPPTARVLSSVRQLQTENVSGRLKILQQLAGIKPYATNVEDNETYEEKQKTRELQEVLDRAGVAPIFKKSFIPKEKIEIK